MTRDAGGDWERFCRHFWRSEEIGLSLDISRMRFGEDFFGAQTARVADAFRLMRALEAGEKVNASEGRMVGHYWLRRPELAPSGVDAEAIRGAVNRIEEFAAAVHSGAVRPVSGERFSDVLLVGIGGSALGPQLLADALAVAEAPMGLWFLDNTDPDGMDRVFAQMGERLRRALVIVTSKSGETKETRNGMLEVRGAMGRLGVSFERQAVAVTMEGKALDALAREGAWLERFPIWDWVGGRTSVTSAVGLLPGALLGIDIRGFLAGAAAMDECTRVEVIERNPAMLLALMWYRAGNGRGDRDMVILPYRDRLALFGKYLQQLVMESLGKGTDLADRPVEQGIVVYGNKGSTDQHAYVQQLRDGLNNFFVTFIGVSRVRESGRELEVEPGVTSGDYLEWYLRGTRAALSERGRQSMTVTLDRLTPDRLGALIALFERAVGFYAGLVNVNAYDQPGVQAGKRAATDLLRTQAAVLGVLREGAGREFGAEEIAGGLGGVTPEEVYHILVHLAANATGVVRCVGGTDPAGERYRLA